MRTSDRSLYQEDTHFPAKQFERKTRLIAGQQVAYIEAGSQSPTLLMVHGNPVSGFIFHRLVARLEDMFHCVVPDLVGFGHSSKPRLESAYSLPMHINALAELIRTLDLQSIVLVAHDWGGPIGLGAALQEPERYTHLVLLNTLSTPVMRIAPIYQLPFRFFNRAGTLFSFLVRRLNFFQRIGVGIMTPADQQLILAAHPTPDSRSGIAAFPKMIPYHSDHPTARILGNILDRATQWEIPSLVLYSDHDSVFTPQEGAALAGRLATGSFREIKGPRHFLQYQAPDRVALAIMEFLNPRSAT